ncbi:MAG: twin-arginine translocase TatA/TatE family subunit [Clostridia bacterium]|nr:twin-arginine translocase TatA/TatE family subunit [Clostridia bacterium]
MFNIGFAELILVLIVAFLIVGPKDLPKVARWIARQIIRRAPCCAS